MKQMTYRETDIRITATADQALDRAPEMTHGRAGLISAGVYHPETSLALRIPIINNNLKPMHEVSPQGGSKEVS